jgi:hypothetical protein
MIRVFDFRVMDEQGRPVNFRVQVSTDQNKIACWNIESGNGGTVSIMELFQYCCLKQAGGGR